MTVGQETRDAWELASFVVTALGLPFAIGFFAWEERKERDNEEEAAYQLLSLFERAYLVAYKPKMSETEAGAGTAGTTTCANGVAVRTFTTPCHCFCAAKTHNSRVICAASPKRNAATGSN